MLVVCVLLHGAHPKSMWAQQELTDRESLLERACVRASRQTPRRVMAIIRSSGAPYTAGLNGFGRKALAKGRGCVAEVRSGQSLARETPGLLGPATGEKGPRAATTPIAERFSRLGPHGGRLRSVHPPPRPAVYFQRDCREGPRPAGGTHDERQADQKRHL